MHAFQIVESTWAGFACAFTLLVLPVRVLLLLVLPVRVLLLLPLSASLLQEDTWAQWPRVL